MQLELLSPVTVDAVLSPVHNRVVDESVGMASARPPLGRPVDPQILPHVPSDVPVGPLTGAVAWMMIVGVPIAVVDGTGDVSPSK